MKTSSKNTKQLNLFVMGGKCGREIYRTDTPTKEILKDTLRINLRVIALSNSRKMYFDEDGFH
jgi:aspartokinase/homoserine dehydrogenase 1